MTPWLSVLIPVFNGGATLARTLASLSGQAEGVEVIGVDQASTDDSRDILRSADFPIRILEAPENSNWMRNTNMALQAATAPVVTMLHQDDLWRPGRAVLLRAMLDGDPDVRLWLHAADYVNARDRVIGLAAPPFGKHQGRADV